MPGAGKQSDEVQQKITELLNAGFDPTTIHRRLKVGRSSIYRMKRCLQQHGTAYMPVEMNKKNGRPKVLTADQELEVRDWLRDLKNRGRYLDDLVWLIHDRFGIVCSTTTMSKMKRKWLRAIECEETGQPIDDLTRRQLMETHPSLPILHQAAVQTAPMMMQHHQQQQQSNSYPDAPLQTEKYDTQIEPTLRGHGLPLLDARLQPHPPLLESHYQQQQHHQHHNLQIDSRLEQQIQQMGSSEPPRA